MSRRAAAQLAVATLLVTGSPTASANYPRQASCPWRVEDDASDESLGVEAAGEERARTDATASTLDILAVTPRLTPDRLEVFLYVASATTPKTAEVTADRYVVSMYLGARHYTFAHQVENNENYYKDVHRNFDSNEIYPRVDDGAPFAVTDITVDVRDLVEGSLGRGLIYLAVPRAEVESRLGHKIADGDRFDRISATTFRLIGRTLLRSDWTDVPAEDAVYVVGDDACFGREPLDLLEVTAPTVQYGDPSSAWVFLADRDGWEVPGKRVDFTVGSAIWRHATSDEDGLVEVSFAAPPAGSYPVTARFSGDAEYGPRTVRTTLVVRPEGTRLARLAVSRPSASSRTVTTVLTDDDAPGNPLAGQRITWYVDGRKAGTSTTDRNGRAVFRSARPGQRVEARFAGVSGRYAAASTKAVRV